ncbi:hypothetical protein Bbelb_026660 [Branchiostoma belcheri]|nr:hypothetical protein Bbelb_026660 [Branchiostoma belcheri]
MRGSEMNKKFQESLHASEKFCDTFPSQTDLAEDSLDSTARQPVIVLRTVCPTVLQVSGTTGHVPTARPGTNKVLLLGRGTRGMGGLANHPGVSTVCPTVPWANCTAQGGGCFVVCPTVLGRGREGVVVQ